MATIQPVITPPSGYGYGAGDGSTLLATWTFNSASDTPAPIAVPKATDVTFQATGTFTGPPTIALNGSNDGVNFTPLNKYPAGTAVTGTAAFINQVLEHPVVYQPTTTVAAGSIVVTMLFKFSSPIDR